jgi:hypothetical protein
MEHRTVNHDTSIFELPLISLCFEVKNLDGSIFTRCKEPFVLFLELNGDSISIDSIKDPFLVEMANVKDFNMPKRARSNVLAIVT